MTVLALEASGDRRPRARAATLLLALVLVTVMVISLGVGPAAISPADLIDTVHRLLTGEEVSPANRAILVDIRLPRLVMGAMVGALLAVAGAIMQGFFRNPLADPGLIGVSSGASLGAVVAIVLGDTVLAPLLLPLGTYRLPVMAFLGGLAVTAILYSIATRRGRTSVATMLLAGIALAALAGAITGVLIYMSDDRQLRDITFWSLGSLGGATWQKIGSLLPFLAAAVLAMPLIARGLDAIVLGEAEARHLGIRVQALKRIAVLLVAGATGAAVAVSGTIGFVGLVVPHLLRLAIGPEHRFLLPTSALLGAALTLAADMVSRVIVAPAELPIGIITAVIGAPFFLWILLRRRGLLEL